MKYAQWQAAIKPKVQGTYNLHHQFGNTLDFFIMLSSAAGISGNTSQSNYTAGNTFQDAFARFRTSQNLPAVTLDLGMVKSVGYVAETKGVAERLMKIGYRPLEEEEVLRLIEAAILQPKREQKASQIVTGLATFQEDDDIAWRQERRFLGLKRYARSSAAAAGGSNQSANPFKEAIANSVSLGDAENVITGAIIGKLSEMFLLAEEEIDRSMPLTKYGVDSLVAVELRNWLIARVATELSIFDVLQSESLVMLSKKVAEKSRFVKEAGLLMV